MKAADRDFIGHFDEEHEMALRADHLKAGANFIKLDGREILEDYGDARLEYRALREGVGLADWSARGKLWVTGSDRHRFLGGMLTNRVEGMAVGEGNHSAVTEAQGRTLLDLWIHSRENGFCLETDPGFQIALVEALDKYLIADDVRITDQTEQEAALGVVGPQSTEIVDRIFGCEASGFSEQHSFHLNWEGIDCTLVRRRFGGEPSYSLWVQNGDVQRLWGTLCDAGSIPVGHRALEILRIESGVPRCGIDFDERVMPLECGLLETVDFGKGCYIGQEAIAKMHHRGKPRRSLVGLQVAAESPPEPETPVTVEGRAVGWVTSSIRSVALDEIIALASIGRTFASPGQSVLIGENIVAEVVKLPFSPGSLGDSYSALSGSLTSSPE